MNASSNIVRGPIHYLTNGALRTDCGVAVSITGVTSEPRLATTFTLAGRRLNVSSKESLVTCRSCRRAFCHKGVEQ